MYGIEVIPSAKRLITSLRDMGYDFTQAVADIVDNSIEAKSTRVSIDVEFDGDDSWLRIADNGRGMRPDELREAMRYGSARSYEADDLGKFGLGLKTASMSQCQHLSVASRWNPDRADVAAYSWDLDHIERTNKWEIIPIEKNGLGPNVREPLKDSTGTVVLWQRLDRILGFKHPYGESARKRLSQMCRDLEMHLGMVFHRFLMNEVKRKPLKLLLNGNQIAPWDPFCRSEPLAKRLDTISLAVEHEGVSDTVILEPFVLPHEIDFSSTDAFRAAAGPARWNQQQGFYMYRAGRMIQSGGWSNLHAPDEHLKLARIAINFTPKSDDAFKINVAKMRVQLPAQIRDQVKQAMVPVRKLARETYDRKKPGSKMLPPSLRGASITSDPPVTSPRQGWGASPDDNLVVVAETLTFEQWSKRLLANATANERPILEAVLKRMNRKADCAGCGIDD